MPASMPRACVIALILLSAGIAMTGCSRTIEPERMNPFLNARSAEHSKLSLAEVQQSYEQSLNNNHVAMIGSQLTREVIVNNYLRFVMASRSSATSDVLQGNFSSFGYFNAPSKTARREYCKANTPYAGAVLVATPAEEARLPPCRDGSGTTRIQLGYSLRGFAVPITNRFAQSLTVASLAKASQKPGGALWSDLDPSWPKRRIRWIFSAQADFISDLRSLGIQPPARYQLAATYGSAYQNLGNHPDNLLLAPTNPSLSARLQGARFRILPVRLREGDEAVAADPENLNTYPTELVKGLYFYLNTASAQACITRAFADFMLQHNATLMAENDLTPLSPAQRQSARMVLRKLDERSPLGPDSPTLCRAYAQFMQQQRP